MILRLQGIATKIHFKIQKITYFLRLDFLAIKNPPKWELCFYILSICFLKAMAEKTAAVAPIVFAKTSVTSAVLVLVRTLCSISMVIPKNTENINETKYAL